jgi:UDP-N-acetylmuramoyl-tripeptide--D-alanyl-D-alanine ligase
LHAGVTCLVKGSRSAGMEQVVAALGGNADKTKGNASDVA